MFVTDFQKSSQGFLWNHAGRVSESLLVYVFTVLIARSLGAAANGLYATFISLTQLMLILSSLGLETVAISQLPKYSSDGTKRSRLIIGLLVTRLVFLGIIGCICLLSGERAASFLNIPPVLASFLGIVFVYFAFQSGISLLSIILLSEFRARQLSIVKVLVRLIEVAGAFVLIRSGGGLKEILVMVSATSCATMVSLLLILGSSARRGESAPFDAKQSIEAIRPFLKFGSMMYLTGVFEFILSKQTDILLLNKLWGDTVEVGHYDVATNFAQVINFGLTSGMYGISVASFSALSTREPSVLPKYWDFLGRFVLLLVVPAFVLSFVFAGSLIPFVYSNAYIPSVVLFQVFVVFLLCTRVMGGGIAADYIQSVARPGILLLSSAAGGGVNLILALLLIPRYGGLGAIIATGAGMLVISLIHGLYVMRRLKVGLFFFFCMKLVAISVISALLAKLSLGFIFLNHVILIAIVYTLIYLLFLIVIKPLNKDDVMFFGRIPDWFEKLISLIIRREHHLNILTDRQKWAYSWISPGETIADIGSSISPLLTLLEKKYGKVIALDTDHASLEEIRRRFPHIRAIESSCLQIPMESCSCDTVLLLDVLEHVDDDRKAVDEIFRILKPGGQLILSVPNKGLFGFLDPQNLTAKLRGEYSQEGEHRHYSEEDILELLGSNFKIVRKHYGGLFLYPVTFAAENVFRKHFGISLGRLLRRIGDWDNDISWGKLSYNLIIEARKI
jgi:O-antigen/teichoic acid export membrane protein/SAM-dependent methyltransferase